MEEELVNQVFTHIHMVGTWAKKKKKFKPYYDLFFVVEITFHLDFGLMIKIT